MSMRAAIHRQILLAVAVPLAWGAALAAPATVAVHPDLMPVFDLLAPAYPGPTPDRVTTTADLDLEPGTIAWDDLRSVAVLPGVRLTVTSDTAEAHAFADFARSPAAQRVLIAAGLLPSTVTIKDQAGRTVVVPQPVQRVSTSYAPTTYLAYGLGAGDRVVLANYLGARDPAGAAAMTRIDPRFVELGTIAPQETTNVEVIARLAPDVVFAAARSEWIPSVEALGIAVIAFEGESAERLREAVRIAGAIFGPDAASRAEAWVAYSDHVATRIAADLAAVPERPRVLFTGTQRTRVASGAMYQTSLIDAAGGVSVTAHLGGYWNDVGIEQVLTWDPDFVLVPPYGGASVAAVVDDPEWRLLRSVTDGRVLRLPKLVAPWDTPVPDSVLAVVWLAEALHPGRVTLACAAETDFFYRRFYGYEIGPDEVAELCLR